MRIKYLMCLLSVIAAIASVHLYPARAQTEVRFSKLDVSLWPEYDRPTVLVIYHIALHPTISLPVDLSLRIPASAGEPSAVAVRQMTTGGESGLFTIPYERQVSGEWGVINITATAPEVQLEYYDSELEKQGAARQYEYRWPGDYAVDSLLVDVQQPLGASEMLISPAAGAGVARNDGLVYYKKDLGSLQQGQTFSLSVSYNKADDELSAANLQVQPSAPVASITPGQDIVMAALPWVLGGLGVLLIFGGGAWYYFSGRQNLEVKPRRKRRKAELIETEDPQGHIYCHNCGKRASSGDRFCRACGTKLRGE